MNSITLSTDIAHRGMGPFAGLGIKPSNTLFADIKTHLQELSEKTGVTCVTATQTSKKIPGKGGKWYFRIFTGVSYDKVLEELQKTDGKFEKQRSIVIVRGNHNLNPAK